MVLTRKNFEGSMVALVTPFRDGKIDELTMRRLIDRQIENRTDIVIPCGTTGESATMSHDEHKSVMSLVVEHVAKRVPVVCGAGSNSTQEAVGLFQHAKKIGADALLVVTPYYNRPTQEGLYRHYEFLAKKVDIPIVLYNVPGRTGVSLAPETVARLAKIPQVIAIKEASGSLDQASHILSLCDISLVSGDDSLTLPLISVGGRGVISVTANVDPKKMSNMVHMALKGDFKKARELHFELLALSKVLFIETNPIPVKTALGLMGLIKGELRLPLCNMSPENLEKLKSALAKMGYLK
ncbi:MAG: 4-hydroxy-tetrahydrodipicolinate synthase [Candidatus Omnitrophica bacterium]|nr:4-hydroxy-tetrahydrodipicolinate synthase [Candidatus Omnitrophota bacterium]